MSAAQAAQAVPPQRPSQYIILLACLEHQCTCLAWSRAIASQAAIQKIQICLTFWYLLVASAAGCAQDSMLFLLSVIHVHHTPAVLGDAMSSRRDHHMQAIPILHAHHFSIMSCKGSLHSHQACIQGALLKAAHPQVAALETDMQAAAGWEEQLQPAHR